MRTEPKASIRATMMCGWKDIASYLGRGVRTVQRYESKSGLPVRRSVGSSKGSVLATKAELDAWVSARPLKQTFTLSRSSEDAPSAWEALAKNIAESRRLRDEMKQLREELHRSVELMRASFRCVLTDVNEESWQNPRGLALPYERGNRKLN